MVVKILRVKLELVSSFVDVNLRSTFLVQRFNGIGSLAETLVEIV